MTMTIEPEAPTTPDNPTAPTEVDAEMAAARDRIGKIAAAPVAPWTFVQPLAPWKLYGHGTIPLAYRKVGDRVEIDGSVCDGLRDTPVLQLPEDCRPAGVTMRSISVGGCTGNASAIVAPTGVVFISTDRWSGDRTHIDFGLICFHVSSEQLAQAVAEAAARSPKRRTVRENHNGVIVEVPV
jgi:hypothetical protein